MAQLKIFPLTGNVLDTHNIHGIKVEYEQEKHAESDALFRFRSAEPFIEAHLYANPSMYKQYGFENDRDRETMENEARKVFGSLGMSQKDSGIYDAAPEFLNNDGERIYAHPTSISMRVRESRLDDIISAVAGNKILSVWGCKVHRYVWEYTDIEITLMLQTPEMISEIRKTLFECLKTNRRNKFYTMDAAITNASRRLECVFRTSREIMCRTDKQIRQAIEAEIYTMIQQGLLVRYAGDDDIELVRSANKTEIRQNKIKLISLLRKTPSARSGI